jgi:hypothetical protein
MKVEKDEYGVYYFTSKKSGLLQLQIGVQKDDNF